MRAVLTLNRLKWLLDVSTLKKMIDVVHLTARPDGLYQAQMDSNRIVAVLARYDKHYFNEFEVDDEEEIVFDGVTVRRVLNHFRCSTVRLGTGNDWLTLTCDTDEYRRKLMEPETSGLIELDRVEFGEDYATIKGDLKAVCNVRVPAEQLSRMPKSDAVRLVFDGSTLKVSASEEELESYTRLVQLDDEVGERVEVKLSYEIFKDVVGVLGGYVNVVSFGGDKPVVISSRGADFLVSFMVAPMIE